MLNLVTLASIALATLHSAVPAACHGYVTEPPSRQARCRAGEVPHCGDVQYEPQSVEALAGSLLCNGGGVRFRELNDESLWIDHFAVVPIGTESLPFTWNIVAPHRTRSWEYFLLTRDDTLLYYESGLGFVPGNVVTHRVPVQGLVGRHTVLARWTIADTDQAQYACVDLLIGGRETEGDVAGAAATPVPVAMLYGFQDFLGNEPAANRSDAPVAESTGGAYKAPQNFTYAGKSSRQE